MSIKGSVRSSQLVTTYGVGAMIASGDESFIVAGIDRWERNDEFELHEPRLEKILRVQSFMRPPASEEPDSWDIPVRRFPKYHSCPSCHRLNDIRYFKTPFGAANCTFCEDEPALVPSRFVVACHAGHLDDFPYFVWVHKDSLHAGDSAKLTLETKGESAGLGDVLIRCSCGAERSMDGAFGKNALKGQKRCSGARPWLSASESEECDLTPVTVQRGASNVWFSWTISAISIPPWSDSALHLLDRHWKTLRNQPKEILPLVIPGLNLADDVHSTEDLVAAALHRQAQEAGEVDEEDVKGQEYEALMKGAAEQHAHDQFICEVAADPGSQATRWIPIVKQVSRLREVRVLRGFSRLLPPRGSSEDDGENEGDGRVVTLPGPEHGWLPAIEVIGEGVFMELTSERLLEWEQRPSVKARVQRLADRYRKQTNPDPDVEVTPRFVLIHSLSHALIDQWALESGYSTAALTERLYVREGRAGFMIYTATSDSAGSLGGVVAMTDDGRLDSSLKEAISRASWCSSDPLCIETQTQGADALNLAACHACSLLPETSCEQRNQLLDRALLVGTPEDPDLGFFADLL